MTQLTQPSWYVRALYKRRWVAVSAFLLVFGYAATSTLRQTPIYESTTQLLVEEQPQPASMNARTASAADRSTDDEFYQTQFRMMRSRAIAWRSLTALGLNQPPTEAERQALMEADARLARGGWLERFAAALGAPKRIAPPSANESGWQSARIDGFLAGLAIVPLPTSRLVDVHYRSPDPVVAAKAADAVADAYVAQVQYDELTQRAKVVHIIDAAEIPRLPILPDHPRDLLLGLLSGVLLAIGLAIGLEVIDSRIKSPDDIKAHLALPFLGMVPAVKRKHIKGPSPLLDRGVPASFSESIRGLRTAVLFSSAAEGSRSVMVTSTAPGEGKTVIAGNLGDALAQAKQRTIIVDGDMRRPRLHETFELAQEPGLSNVLAGTVPLAAAIRKTNNPYLHVLPAGPIATHPAELLGSKPYLELLEELGRAYDWIVIDAPPVMAVTDAAIISNSVDGVVFVIGSEMIPHRNAQIAVEQLVGVRARIVGALLNRVHVDRHSFYYAQYYRKDYTQQYVRPQ
jgi:capsular exopolysaccharide synthesis family protein